MGCQAFFIEYYKCEKCFKSSLENFTKYIFVFLNKRTTFVAILSYTVSSNKSCAECVGCYIINVKVALMHCLLA